MSAEQSQRMMSMCESARVHVDELLVVLAKSKMLNILYILNCDTKPLRFSEIKRRVNSSSTTVTRRLGELEKHDLVTRTVFPTVPTTVEYSLTKAGIALQPSLESLFDWVLDFADESQN
ncbi:helix-turn-helix transcriptional regulator [Candidatus Poseidoniaceae archaeon]|nr:helix-turn-helix transcriptional regulator [Candidatus Poseidoniaceae archaeon]